MKEAFENLVAFYFGSSERFKTSINLTAPRNIILFIYGKLVWSGELTDISQLEHEAKISLFNEAKIISKHFNKDYLIEVCKCLHLYKNV